VHHAARTRVVALWRDFSASAFIEDSFPDNIIMNCLLRSKYNLMAILSRYFLEKTEKNT